jgi:hypothetical protein
LGVQNEKIVVAVINREVKVNRADSKMIAKNQQTQNNGWKQERVQAKTQQKLNKIV